MADLSLHVLTPAGPIFEGRVASVVVPTEQGDIQVLPSHADYLGVLGVGILRSVTLKESWLLTGGTLSVVGDDVRVLADSVLDTSCEEAKQLAGSYKLFESKLGKSDTLSEEERREALKKFRQAQALVQSKS